MKKNPGKSLVNPLIKYESLGGNILLQSAVEANSVIYHLCGAGGVGCGVVWCVCIRSCHQVLGL